MNIMEFTRNCLVMVYILSQILINVVSKKKLFMYNLIAPIDFLTSFYNLPISFTDLLNGSF